jgi:hypothetical protein
MPRRRERAENLSQISLKQMPDLEPKQEQDESSKLKL